MLAAQYSTPGLQLRNCNNARRAAHPLRCSEWRFPFYVNLSPYAIDAACYYPILLELRHRASFPRLGQFLISLISPKGGVEWFQKEEKEPKKCPPVETDGHR